MAFIILYIFSANAALASQLAEAEQYLNQITTLTADFQQIAPDGSYGNGKLSVKRPGKMRWNYIKPSKIQMVMNGDSLTYYDPEMDEVSYLSIDDTLAAIVAKPQIAFDSADTERLSVREEAGLLRVMLRARANPDNGTLTLVFRTQPIELYQFVLENAAGEVTIITLDEIRFGVPLDDELFYFRRPD